MTYQETIEYIKEISARGSKPGLERIERILSCLGNPQNDLRVIHVGGTNGKGSYCAMLSAVLAECGYKSVTFTSPYLERVNEMFLCNGKEISDDDFARVSSKIRPFCDETGGTEYEFFTAVAFEYFSSLQPDIAVIECCMGGLLDATNVIKAPIMSVITSLDIDHTSFLGSSIEEIAVQKAGIFKHGCPSVVFQSPPNAISVFREKAELLLSPFSAPSLRARNVRSSLEGSLFDFDEYKDVFIPLASDYQIKNALSVLYTLSVMKNLGYGSTEDSVRAGLKKTVWRGRFEVLLRDPVVIFDGCHNLHGVTSVAKTVSSLFNGQRLIMITGVMRDKEYKKMAHVMAPYAKKVLTVTPSNKRALDADILCGVYEELGVESVACGTVASALKYAFGLAQQSDSIMIFGSLYMYSEVKKQIDNLLKFGK